MRPVAVNFSLRFGTEFTLQAARTKGLPHGHESVEMRKTAPAGRVLSFANRSKTR